MNTERIKIIVSSLLGMALMYCLMRSCDNSNTTTVTIPAKKGSFEAVKPKQNVYRIDKGNISKTPVNKGVNTSETDRIKSMYNFSQTEIDSLMNEARRLNDLLVDENASTEDLKAEIKRLSQYIEFTLSDKDSAMAYTISGFAQGKVERVKLDYTIFPQPIIEPIIDNKEEKVFRRVLMGFSAGSNKELSQGIIEVNAAYQNTKGSIYEASYTQLNSQQYYQIGIKVPILNF